jgi:hypothetical protein
MGFGVRESQQDNRKVSRDVQKSLSDERVRVLFRAPQCSTFNQGLLVPHEDW